MADQWLTAYAELLDSGIALANHGQMAEAIEKYDAAINLAPHLSPGYINRGLALLALKRPADAMVDMDQAVALQPTLAVAYNNRGVVRRALGDMDAAAQDYLKAIELAGDAAIDAHGNLATYFFETQQYERAVAYYEKAIAVQPDDARAHWNFGMCLLLLGELERGWREYHWRWSEPSYQSHHRSCKAKLWLGLEPLAGKTILLQAEQGFGDMIQFCRYATLVAAKGARVLLEVQAPLVALCQSLSGVTEVFSTTDALPSFDFYCPMMSLPLAFSTTLQTIPAPRQYLTSDPAKVHKWQNTLGIKTKPRVGIVWNSDPNLAVGASKSMSLQTFSQLLSESYEFVSLQKKLSDDEVSLLGSLSVVHFQDALMDFSDTAALCELMDMVISVDTSVAHLAGALGKPVSILLHWHADWRWLLHRSDSVWYPTAKLYRQETRFEWDAALAAVQSDMAQRLR